LLPPGCRFFGQLRQLVVLFGFDHLDWCRFRNGTSIGTRFR
jgi:hypothetical protein